jgi:hypothetical protein
LSSMSDESILLQAKKKLEELSKWGVKRLFFLSLLRA